MKKRTYKDRREYIIKAVKKRRKKIRAMAVKYKGGKCCVCGYNRCSAALEFHHVDPKKKNFTVSSRHCTWGWAKVRAELDKCIMMCSNCHREFHHCMIPGSLTGKTTGR